MTIVTVVTVVTLVTVTVETLTIMTVTVVRAQQTPAARLFPLFIESYPTPEGGVLR